MAQAAPPAPVRNRENDGQRYAASGWGMLTFGAVATALMALLLITGLPMWRGPVALALLGPVFIWWGYRERRNAISIGRGQIAVRYGYPLFGRIRRCRQADGWRAREPWFSRRVPLRGLLRRAVGLRTLVLQRGKGPFGERITVRDLRDGRRAIEAARAALADDPATDWMDTARNALGGRR